MYTSPSSYLIVLIRASLHKINSSCKCYKSIGCPVLTGIVLAFFYCNQRALVLFLQLRVTQKVLQLPFFLFFFLFPIRYHFRTDWQKLFVYFSNIAALSECEQDRTY